MKKLILILLLVSCRPYDVKENPPIRFKNTVYIGGNIYILSYTHFLEDYKEIFTLKGIVNNKIKITFGKYFLSSQTYSWHTRNKQEYEVVIKKGGIYTIRGMSFKVYNITESSLTYEIVRGLSHDHRPLFELNH